MITQFTIGFSRTVNLGNFESMRMEAAVTVACPEEGDFAQMKLAAQTQLRQLIEDTYRHQHADRQEKKKSA